ncbi:MAG: metallophosphoesterase [Euryarchaeota archaeon]|nr:metallophosphoesterase [Euryarchaeota archaeon]
MSVPCPIHDYLALEIEEAKAVCVGDLHIGLESELRSKGVHVPSQTHRMERELIHLSPGRERVILLGDLKNRVPGSSRQEYVEIPKFIRVLQRHYKIVDVVRGNHDTNIEDFLPKNTNIHPASGFVLGDIGFVHGHTWPSPKVMSCRYLVMAHNHPTVALEDSLGNISKEPCWVRFPIDDVANNRYMKMPEEVIMIPAFNRSLGGSPINLKGGKMLGPLFSDGMIDVRKGKVYLTDGIYLGTIADLLVRGDSPIRTLSHRKRVDH